MKQMTDTSKTRVRSRFFYGYTIVAAAAIILVVMHGINASFGIFFTPLQNQFGWNRATIAGATSICFFLTGLFSIFAGRVNDKYGPKVTIAVSSCLICIGYFLMSGMQSVWQLYFFYGFIVALGNSGGDMALLPTVAKWFVKRRSLMSSIVKSGTGTGIFIMPLVSAWLITMFGWRTAYGVLALLAVGVIFGFSRFLKRDPSEVGLHPYGEAETVSANHGKSAINLSLKEVLHTRQFWLLSSTYFMIWYATQSAMIHIAPHAVDIGLSVGRAAVIVSAIGGFSILGRLTMGNAGDRIGTRKSLLICFAILLTALTWLQFANQTWMLYVFAPIYGFAHGSFFAIVSPLVADLFGLKSHGSNLGFLFFIGMSGGAVGPIVTGRLFDITHDYQTGFAIMLAAAVIGFALASLIRPIKQK
jgi:MFS family permease